MIAYATYRSVLNGLSSAAKKVYSACPKDSDFTGTEVLVHLKNNGDGSKDLAHVTGCLNTLSESGLLSEVGKGVFRYIKIREKPKPKEQTPDEPPTTQSETAQADHPKRSALEILADLAERAKSLSQDIETAAIEVEEMVNEAEAGARKLRQLQQLLKSLD